jgi:hypothetical protein
VRECFHSQLCAFCFGTELLAQELDKTSAFRNCFLTVVWCADLGAGFLTRRGTDADIVAYGILLSVFLGAEDRRDAAIGLSYDPDFSARAERIGREDPEIIKDREVILLLVLLVEVSPVAVLMAAQELHGILTSTF